MQLTWDSVQGSGVRTIVMNVLLIEDDTTIGKAVQKGLREEGFECEWVRNGKSGLRLAQTQVNDIIVLDLLLPDLPGLDVISQIRGESIRTPILVLSALGSVEQRVAGLSKGADDYLVKPFAFAELIARLEALTRRSLDIPSQQYVVGPLTLDLTVRRVARDGREIDLTPTEFSLLEFLMRHAGKLVTRTMLCEHLWEADWEGVTNVVDVHVSRLRSKIDKGYAQSLLHTVRGRGYTLRAQNS